MSDTKPNQIANATAWISEAFADLEDVYAGVNKANDDLGIAENGRDSARRDIMDSCALFSVTHSLTEEEIGAAVRAAIAAYKGNAIGSVDAKGNNKTLANLGSELKNAMHPKVREKLPELRKLANDTFTKMEAAGQSARDQYKRADIMVSSIAGDVAKDRMKAVPTTLAQVTARVKAKQTVNAENVSKAKAKIRAIVATCDDMARVFPLSQLSSIKTLLNALLDDEVLKSALVSSAKAAKAASNLRGANGKAKAAPAEGASTVSMDDLNDQHAA